MKYRNEGWKWLEWLEMAGIGWIWLEMTRNGLKWLEWLELAGNARNIWKWLNMSGIDRK